MSLSELKIFLNYFKVETQYVKNLHELYNDLPFLPEIKKVNKVKKLVANFQNKKQ